MNRVLNSARAARINAGRRSSKPIECAGERLDQLPARVNRDFTRPVENLWKKDGREHVEYVTVAGRDGVCPVADCLEIRKGRSTDSISEVHAGAPVSGAFCSTPTRTSWTAAVWGQPLRPRSNSCPTAHGRCGRRWTRLLKSRHRCGPTSTLRATILPAWEPRRERSPAVPAGITGDPICGLRRRRHERLASTARPQPPAGCTAAPKLAASIWVAAQLGAPPRCASNGCERHIGVDPLLEDQTRERPLQRHHESDDLPRPRPTGLWR